MTGHVIISHGLQSSPEATKATAIARVATSLGWSFDIPDYRDLDAIGELGDVQARIARLQLGVAANRERPREKQPVARQPRGLDRVPRKLGRAPRKAQRLAAGKD